MDLNSLPKEVLLNIFSYLNVKEKIELKCVCQLWNTLLLDGVKHIRFVSIYEENRISLVDPNIIIAQSFEDIYKTLTENNFQNLRSIDMIGLHLWNGDINLMNLRQKLRNIVSFTYFCDVWKMQEGAIEILLGCLSNLEKISWYDKSINSKLAEFILKNNPNVNYLNVRSIKYDDVYSLIDAVSQRWKGLRMTVSCICKDERSVAAFDSLEKLSVSTCPTMIESGSLDNLIGSQKLKQLLIRIHPLCCEYLPRNLKIPQLRSESLEVLGIDTIPYTINNTSLIMQRVPNLKVLDMRSLPFTDSDVEFLTRNCRSLQYLLIDHGEITDNSLESLLNLPRLEVLLLIGNNAVTVEAMNDFIEKAPSLRVLSCNLEVIEALITRANRVQNCLHFAFIRVLRVPQVIPTNLYITYRYQSAAGHPIDDNIWCQMFYFYDNLNIDNDYFEWKRIRISELQKLIAINYTQNGDKHKSTSE